MRFYAKSKPAWPQTETIQQHVDTLLRCYYILKQNYAHRLSLMTEHDWSLLLKAVLYHDVGKYDAVFQNNILRRLKQPLLDVPFQHNIRHNFISVLAIPYDDWELTEIETQILVQAVGYHHEGTPIENSFNEQAQEIYQYSILPHKEQIEYELNIQLNPTLMNSISMLGYLHPTNRLTPSDGLPFLKYVLIKGLLHRLDHAASAHVDIELAVDMAVGEYVNTFIHDKLGSVNNGVIVPGRKNKLQLFAEQNQRNHLVVIAQTGMGKTEAGLLWLGEDKGFFTLPLRVSINSMYTRIVNPNGLAFTQKDTEYGVVEQATGLLHSNTLDYLQTESKKQIKPDADDESLEKTHTQSAQYANKLIISTIDQILKFPLYYLSFEKEYATMSYAKVIIDELQAYDPRLAAVIIRALVMIDSIGGSFMIMTATLPKFYYHALWQQIESTRSELKKNTQANTDIDTGLLLQLERIQPELIYDEFIDDTVVRHHLHIRSESIMDGVVLQQIMEQGEQFKVLVICNTIKRAREVYQSLSHMIEKSEKLIPVMLLHAKFIRNKRTAIENDIIQFARAKAVTGIYVTTQLVEASLDIDFDRLHTEMSSLDSQFQRYGRCNRSGLKSVIDANVYVYTSDVSGINLGKRSIYHDDIYTRSMMLYGQLKQGILTETEKRNLIDALYDEQALASSSFKLLFDETLIQLSKRSLYEINRKQAQDLLRDIHEIAIIPDYFRGNREIEQALDDWAQAAMKYKNPEQIRLRRRKARQKLEGYTVGINEYTARSKGLLTPLHPNIEMYYANVYYDEDTGLDMSQLNTETSIIW